mgnify:CR=1 FL=1
MEKAVYEKASSTGFLGGKLRVDAEGNTVYDPEFKEGKQFNGKVIVPARTEEERILLGDMNRYEFGEDLPAELKLQLITSHEIQPIVLFVDELNRSDAMVMKELMNFILTKKINGLNLPWFCFLVSAINPSSQNSTYSTNELDPAQIDRFLKIKTNASLKEWQEYAMESGINDEYVVALGSSAESFTMSDKSIQDTDDLGPSPRSHELCASIYQYRHDVSNTPFFTAEERACEEDDVRELFIGKIGTKAGNQIFKMIQNADNNIKPEEILTGKAATVDTKIVDKLSRMIAIAKQIISKNVLNYLSTEAIKFALDASSDAAAKKTWANMNAQLKHFLSLLDNATELVFAKKSLDTKINIEDTKYKKYNDKMIYTYIIGCYSADIISQFKNFGKVDNLAD